MSLSNLCAKKLNAYSAAMRNLADTEVNDIAERFTDSKALHLAIEAAGLFCWDWDLERGVLNVPGSEIGMIAAEDRGRAFTAQEWVQCIHPDDFSVVWLGLDRFLRGNTGRWSGECRLRFSDDSWQWVILHGSASHWDDCGKPLRLVGTVRNIDARKKNEIELNLQDEILLDGARVAELGAWQYHVVADKVHWSRGGYDIFDLDGDEPPPVDECISYYIPRDRVRLRQALEDVIALHRNYDMECEIMSATGVRKFVRVIGRIGTMEGLEASRIVGVIQDVTQSRKLQTGMRAFFRLTPDLVGAVAFDGTPVNLSPSWESALGWTFEDLKASGIETVVHEDDREAMRQLLKKIVHLDYMEKLENRVVSRAGDVRWFSWRIFADKSTDMVFVAARDITHQKMEEEALIEAKLQAEEASRVKSEFLAKMSHELRTPLNPILGFSDLLIEETDNPQHVEMLQSINAAGAALLTVVEDFLDVSQIDSGYSEVRRDVFDLEDLVERNIAVLKGQLNGRSVDLGWNFELSQHFSKGQRFVGDQEKISRILINIIGNAIKFTEQGEVHLDCSVHAINDARAMLHIDVVDTGIGIAKESLDSLFDSFEQVDSSKTRRYGGMGLGLAICKKLTELMGGSIAVSSELGRGSTFSLILPLGVPVAPRTEVVVAPEIPAQPGALCDECDLPVLLVEDEELHVAYIQHILELKGCAVTVAKSGEEALALYAPFQYSIILLDIHLPGMSGIDVLKSIRGNEAKEGKGHVPILVLTADVLPATHEVCSANGVDGILNKPVCSKDLRGMMAELLGVTAESGG